MYSNRWDKTDSLIRENIREKPEKGEVKNQRQVSASEKLIGSLIRTQ